MVKDFEPAYWFWGYDDVVEDEGAEIDDFEFAGDEPNKPVMTLHRWSNHAQVDENCITSKNMGVDYSLRPHTFSLEWDEFRHIYRIDDNIIRIDYRYFDLSPKGLDNCEDVVPQIYTINPYFANRPMSVIMNLGISLLEGQFGGPPDMYKYNFSICIRY